MSGIHCEAPAHLLRSPGDVSTRPLTSSKPPQNFSRRSVLKFAVAPGEIFEWHLHVSESLTPRRPSWGNRGVWRNIPVLSLPSLICRRCWQEAWAAGGERSHCPQLNQFTIRSEPPSSPLRWTRTGSGSADDCKKKKKKKRKQSTNYKGFKFRVWNVSCTNWFWSRRWWLNWCSAAKCSVIRSQWASMSCQVRPRASCRNSESCTVIKCGWFKWFIVYSAVEQPEGVFPLRLHSSHRNKNPALLCSVIENQDKSCRRFKSQN